MKPRKMLMNRPAGIFLLTALLLCTARNLPARGSKEKKEEPKTVEVTASGTVRLVGSSPMTSLVISGEDREWQVEPSEEKKLMHLQQQTVTVTGMEYYIDYAPANGNTFGMAAGGIARRRYFIKSITVISPNSE